MEYKLSEAEEKIRRLLPGNLQLSSIIAPRFEIYMIDRRFTGNDRSLYQAFQIKIKIALKINTDR